MNKGVLVIFLGVLLTVAAGTAIYRASRAPAPRIEKHSPIQTDQNHRQREQAIDEAKRIVAEHPAIATTSEDDPGLKKAREERLEAMAEAVRRAMATPTPDPEKSRE